jgi:hypothetical protein
MTAPHMTDKQATIWLLTILQAILNEQVKAKLLKREVGDYIYEGVKDQARKLGWID